MNDVNFDDCFQGKCLYGDDFTIEQIEEWYKDEAEGYSSLFDDVEKKYQYSYHALNVRHGFSKLPNLRFSHAMGLGSAFGYEFRPIIGKLDRITILDPSEKFVTSNLDGVPVEYRKPNVSGTIPMDDHSVNLVTCFGTLHHIPNVTHVVNEIGRVLVHGGYALVREPVVNMGDWRKPRRGLTKRERGIPKSFMEDAFMDAGLRIVHQAPCMFPLIPRVASLSKSVGPAYNSRILSSVDAMASAALAWNVVYNRTYLAKKFAPTSVFWVCQRE